ncbi:MAG: hypothetical protein NZZ41_06980 [Candidatus Dojkabacteria bacterium]|nr:hypothetical protein [Candidatus Dojkabacteria bacterium]
MSHIQLDREGRIYVDLKPVRNLEDPIDYIYPTFNFFTIVPLVMYRNEDGSMYDNFESEVYEKLSINYQPTDRYNQIDLQFARRLNFLIENGYLLIRLNGIQDLERLFLRVPYREGSFDIIERFTNIKNNIPLRSLYYVLRKVAINCLFVYLKDDRDPISYPGLKKYKLGSLVLPDYDQNFDLKNYYDVYLEYGMRFCDFYPYYFSSSASEAHKRAHALACKNEAQETIKSLINTIDKNMVILDSNPLHRVDDADQENSALTSTYSDKELKNIVSLCGWVLNEENLIYPPTVIYTNIIIKQWTSPVRFNTIVNKKYNENFGLKAIKNYSRDTLAETITKVQNGELRTNLLIIKDGYAIFLTDKNMRREKNSLMWDSGVRAANFAAKIITSILKSLIGRNIENINTEELEKDINYIIQTNNPDLDLEFSIFDVIEEENKLLCGLNVRVFSYTYVVKLDIEVK